jgi:hypothetical protein
VESGFLQLAAFPQQRSFEESQACAIPPSYCPEVVPAAAFA